MSKNLKKIILVGMALVFALSGSALAAWDVRTAISSEPISGTLNSCEKYGAVTFTFQENAEIWDGDEISIDLATGSFACHDQDYVLLSDLKRTVSPIGTLLPQLNDPSWLPTQVPAPAVAPAKSKQGTLTGFSVLPGDYAEESFTSGAWAVNPINKGGAYGLTLTGTGTGLYARVITSKDSRRIIVKFYDDDSMVKLDDTTNSDHSTQIKIQTNTQLTLTIFNGETHLLRAYKDFVSSATPTKDGVYGTNLVSGSFDNFLCGKQDSTFVGDLVNVSFDSRSPVQEDIFTFQGQRQIAHYMAQQINMQACSATKKDVDLCGFIAWENQAKCEYNYETAAGYCPDATGRNFTNAGGNQMIIQTTADNFGTAYYYFEFELSGAAGTYFGGMPKISSGSTSNFVANNITDYCAVGDIGAYTFGLHSVGLANGTTVAAANFANPSDFPKGDNCTSPAAKSQVRKIRTTSFQIQNMKRFALDFEKFVYDKATAVDGNKADVIVRLMKAPCGVAFTETRCVANYVSTCGAAGGKTTLLFPYTTPLTTSVQGWWFGMAICNPTDTAGDAVIKVYEDGGLKGQTTVNVKAYGTYVAAGETLLTLPGMPAGMGQSTAHIIVECNFSKAGGFGMMGNGIDSTGYTAYGDAGWGF